MTILGIELNDAAITAADSSGVMYREPGYAIVSDGTMLFGRDAAAFRRLQPRRMHSHFWQLMSEQALLADGGDCRTHADIVYAHLQYIWQASGANAEAVVFALPPLWSAEQNGLLLGIAEEIGIPVRGLVASGVAAARQEYTGCKLYHLEATLHDAYLQHVDQDGAAIAGEFHIYEGTGLAVLQQACVAYIARRLLESSRFDALQDASNEQLILNSLAAWLRDLHQAGTTEISIEHGEWSFEATLDLQELQTELLRCLEPLLQQLRAVLPVDEPVALQLHDELGQFPGLVDLLAEQTGAAIFILEPAAAARGAVARASQFSSGSGSLSLTRQLSWDEAAIPVDVSGAPRTGGTAPTHLVWGSRAFRLGNEPVLAGVSLPEDVAGICLEPAAGISRHHFTVEPDAGGYRLQDHSRYGTWLNGHRLDGGVMLRAGDVITVGPHRLLLVAEQSLPEVPAGA